MKKFNNTKPRRKQRACSCCGGEIITWVGYPYTDNEGSQCRKCHISALRKYAQEIEKMKELIEKSLSHNNLYIWSQWTSQRKKLCVFQMMEKGHFKYKIH